MKEIAFALFSSLYQISFLFCNTTLQRPTSSASQSSESEEHAIACIKQETQKASQPALRVINVDKNAAYPRAIADLKAAGILPDHVELRQVKYLNNLIEQDHRFIKRLVKPGLGFFSLETAERTLQGYEIMNMFRKG